MSSTSNNNNLIIPDFNQSPTIDQVGAIERASRFTKRSIKTESKAQGLRLALSMIDLTTLEGQDTEGKVKQMCYKAMHLHDEIPGLPTVAAVCVYPSLVSVAKKAVEGSGINVASVATAFPSGQTNLQVKIDDTKFAVDSGADEVDMVISRGKFHSGDYNYVFDEIAKIKETCGDARLKVMYAGADFIKTSTGKVKPAATMPVTLTMLEAIRDFHDKSGIVVGMKPAGGISNSKLALHYLIMVKEVLGEAWLDKHWFRFGASSLANDVLKQIVKAETGRYQSNDYFSID